MESAIGKRGHATGTATSDAASTAQNAFEDNASDDTMTASIGTPYRNQHPIMADATPDTHILKLSPRREKPLIGDRVAILVNDAPYLSFLAALGGRKRWPTIGRPDDEKGERPPAFCPNLGTGKNRKD